MPTIAILVENKPGALARVSNTFARRGFNIESLAVGPTERPDVSRITLRVDCEHHSLEQIEKQIHKLVNVLRVSELDALTGLAEYRNGGLFIDLGVLVPKHDAVFRDAHAVKQHFSFNTDIAGTTYGRVALGLPSDNPTL